MSIPLAQLSFLDLLRGFVAVGRRMSITQAAQDLHLTQSAVSRQVLALEDRLGAKLLVRGYRSISLTPAGEQLFGVANTAIQQLQDVLAELDTASAARPVRLTASIGVTGLWLLPRLKKFQQLRPGIDLRVSAHNRVLDLRQEGIDLAIRYTSRVAVAPGSTHLFGHRIAPIAHPSLGVRSLSGVERLAGYSLLEYDDSTYPWLRWSHWLASNGWEAARPKSVQHFNQYDQVIQAAVGGQGIALGRLELLQEQLDTGLLEQVGPSLRSEPSDHAYWLVRADEHPREHVRLVANWIEAEAREGQRSAAAHPC
ncbi:LysR substrate-binding domain-containing protein [Paucibacter sp. APW11]|uniref:LysR substrate-binding domain-containing protein n=1 Tax=Roseateles aquae TaxID=3077235 RepID=A0ABU3PGD6_9BURK|nr:LysR substrate-binding domain-containing protein [Paucibacter sp. APW11]MDT9001654.1 LysR substrate-binding domain-containing protein [Paucibacter sp. APW11]